MSSSKAPAVPRIYHVAPAPQSFQLCPISTMLPLHLRVQLPKGSHPDWMGNFQEEGGFHESPNIPLQISDLHATQDEASVGWTAGHHCFPTAVTCLATSPVSGLSFSLVNEVRPEILKFAVLFPQKKY